MRACTIPSLPLSTPGEGETGRRGEGVRSGGGVDRLSCWVVTLLFSPPPRVGGGGCSEGTTPCYRRRGPHTMVVNSILTRLTAD
jgi:hypothetical protein